MTKITKKDFLSQTLGVLTALVIFVAMLTVLDGGYSQGAITLTDLGTLGGNFGAAYAVNDPGQVAGHSSSASWELHAFLWAKEGGMVDLSTPGGPESFGVPINNLGRVVGDSDTASEGTHAFLWTEEDEVVDLGTLGGRWSHTTAVSDLGQVGGHSSTTVGEEHAFLWTEEEGMVDLGTLGGDRHRHIYIVTIKDVGQAVGYDFD